MAAYSNEIKIWMSDRIHELTEEEFMDVINYYGLEVRKKSILCPLHDDIHFGSCVIMGNHAHCFVCGKRIGAADIVISQTDMKYYDACRFILSNILGYHIPNMEEDENLILTRQELAFIGLKGASGGRIQIPVNYVYRTEDVPGIQRNIRMPGNEDLCLVTETVRPPTMEQLYRENKKWAVSLMRGKALDAIHNIENAMDNLHDPESDLFRLCKTKEEMAFIYNILRQQLIKARGILKKINRAAG